MSKYQKQIQVNKIRGIIIMRLEGGDETFITDAPALNIIELTVLNFGVNNIITTEETIIHIYKYNVRAKKKKKKKVIDYKLKKQV